ncbi:farnesol dehydrogenase [Tribolium castaneum]|uniref:Dehydrogenase/reductase SDR family protein 7-like n=1 Tax=Tribolium castaneum TaxID=7070 RepID=D2A464_TRICA|nr:PREDICTED: farnesol dehydrogenase [Tribolium castaneum]EFA04837.1 Dehydrogenase/reductase SDR family protein 7-like [Tribolium castaneum]|eukprot:XP_008195025.1 PREDICTED: farnesol dehydrogenase [Tribolium castaneum]
MVLSMDRWRGKIAVVTGASAGCGAAIAEALVREGLQVVGLARRKARVQTLAEKLAPHPGKLYAVKCDMTVESDILEAFKWIKTTLGPVSILVNNAGLSQPNTLIGGNTQMWKTVLDTNVLGLSIATREALDQMMQNSIAGHIIHINSILGHYVAHVPKLNVYSASKFAVTALTETLRQELVALDSKIRVTSVSPGPVDTEFGVALHDSEDWKKLYNSMPKLQSEDVADAVVYVLSTPPHVQVQEMMIRPLGEPV